MVGDYGNARILVRQSSSGIITGIQDAQGNYATDNILRTLNPLERIFVVLVQAWATRATFLDIVPAIVNDPNNFAAR